MPPRNERISVPIACSPVPMSVGRLAIAVKSAVTTRRLVFFARIAFASSVNDGAMTASMNVEVSAVAVSASISRLRPTMPPNADSGSASRART